jgi:hypothetical protein
MNIERAKYYDDYIVIINIMYEQEQHSKTAQGLFCYPQSSPHPGPFYSL